MSYRMRIFLMSAGLFCAAPTTANAYQSPRSGKRTDPAVVEQRTLRALPRARKRQISKTLEQVAVCVDAYDTSSDIEEVAKLCHKANDSVMSLKLPAGFLRGNLRAGMKAVNYAFLLEAELSSAIEIQPDTKAAIVKEYGLESIPDEKRPAQLKKYGQGFLDLAADYAVHVGITPNP